MAEVALAAAATPSIPSITGAGAGVGASPALGQPFSELLTALAEPTGIAAVATVRTTARPIAPPLELTVPPATPDADVEPRATATKSGGNGDCATDDPADATSASPTPTPDLSAFVALIAPPAQAIASSTRQPAAADVGIATATTRATVPVRSAPTAPKRDLAATNGAPVATALPAIADTMSAAGGKNAPIAPARAPVGQLPAGAAAMPPDAIEATSPNPSVTGSVQAVGITSESRSQDVATKPATVWQPEIAAAAAPSPEPAVAMRMSEHPRDAAPRADASPTQGVASAGKAPPPQGTIAAAATAPATALFTRAGDTPVAVEGTGTVPVPSPPASPPIVDDTSIRTRIVPADQAEPKGATTGGAEPQRAASPHARQTTELLGVADVRIDPAAPRVALAATAAAATTRIADDPVARQLSIAQDGQWLDALTRDIASAGNADGQLRFRLDPDHLGSLTVQITQGSDGASVRLTASTEAARTILADAQPRLVAEARAQGLTLRDATVETRGAAPAPATATPTSSGAGFSGGGSRHGDQGGVAAQLHQQSQQQGGNRPRAPQPARQANLAPRDSKPTRSGADLYA